MNFSETVPGGLCQSIQGTVLRIKMNEVPSNRTITISYFIKTEHFAVRLHIFLWFLKFMRVDSGHSLQLLVPQVWVKYRYPLLKPMGLHQMTLNSTISSGCWGTSYDALRTSSPFSCSSFFLSTVAKCCS